MEVEVDSNKEHTFLGSARPSGGNRPRDKARRQEGVIMPPTRRVLLCRVNVHIILPPTGTGVMRSFWRLSSSLPDVTPLSASGPSSSLPTLMAGSGTRPPVGVMLGVPPSDGGATSFSPSGGAGRSSSVMPGRKAGDSRSWRALRERKPSQPVRGTTHRIAYNTDEHLHYHHHH